MLCYYGCSILLQCACQIFSSCTDVCGMCLQFSISCLGPNWMGSLICIGDVCLWVSLNCVDLPSHVSIDFSHTLKVPTLHKVYETEEKPLGSSLVCSTLGQQIFPMEHSHKDGFPCSLQIQSLDNLCPSSMIP